MTETSQGDPERLFPRRVNGDPVEPRLSLAPSRGLLEGSAVRLEPLDAARHGAALFRASHGDPAAQRLWDYLPWGPFPDEAAFMANLRDTTAMLERVTYAICARETGAPVGMASYLDIQPKAGVIEIGAIWFTPAFQRGRGATEALYLLLAHAMDDLGYRRMQWRCNAENAKSRAAARRLGFRFEGIWFNHMIYKGKNRDTAWYSILDTEWPALREAMRAWLSPATFDAAGTQLQALSELTAACR